jgi:hypothetical protein
MTANFDPLLAAARDWAEQAVASGWLAPGDLRALAELESRSPASLFEAGTHRPLVAAFFGGTGVGKSTLLNRLAGQPIARTGVERPTSREVSVYLHESVQLRSLPKDFPLERVRVAQHRDQRRRSVLWIDMPDIDSIEARNRELVLEWLPHIDVLIYVVSPERYRDDKAWRMLQAHGGEHAWLFVINQWDRGHPVQHQDFGKLLVKGGFQDPVILRTDSRAAVAARKEDDFEELQGFLQQMADQHVIRQLELRAQALRLEGLRAAVGECLGRLGEDGGYEALRPEWSARWAETRAELLRGLEWPIQRVAQAFVGHEASPLRRSIDLTRSIDAAPAQPEAGAAGSVLWDEWAAGRLRDDLDRLVVEAGGRGLPALPLKDGLDRVYRESGRVVLNEGQRSLRQALANPGNALQRTLLRLSGGLAVALPLAAIGLVSYQVVKGYYESFARHLDYLGADFAVHSGLLIVLSWLLPFFAYRQLKPSAERAAIRGLRLGIERALEDLGGRVVLLLKQSEQARAKVREEGRRIARLAAAAVPEAVPETGLLGRVLPAAGGRRDVGGAAAQSMFNSSK